MLPIDQVIGFIRHDDPLVVDLAMDCLKWVRRPERLRGEFVLDAVREGHEPLNKWLPDFAITQSVMDYAIGAMSGKSSGADKFWPPAVIAEAPEQLLTPDTADKLRAAMGLDASWTTTIIREKLANLSLSTEQLRARLVQLCGEADREMTAMSEQQEIRAVADSLADRGDAQWAMEKLAEQRRADFWIETWLVAILHRASHRPAFDMALDRFAEMNTDEHDALISELASVISELCTPADLGRVAALWDRCPEDTRSYLIEEIGHLRFPEAEPLLLKITQASDDLFVKALGATGLCEMICTSAESRRLIEQLIETDDYDTSFRDLKELAVPLGTMLGAPFARQTEWEREVRQERARIAARANAFERSFRGWEKPLRLENTHSQRVAPPPAWSTVPVQTTLEPLTRAKVVGRNDPCPCGSGKKYKKCCLGKAESS